MLWFSRASRWSMLTGLFSCSRGAGPAVPSGRPREKIGEAHTPCAPGSPTTNVPPGRTSYLVLRRSDPTEADLRPHPLVQVINEELHEGVCQPDADREIDPPGEPEGDQPGNHRSHHPPADGFQETPSVGIHRIVHSQNRLRR